MKIAYCIPSLYTPSGMERVLTLKANYFAEKLNHDIYIIMTDGKDRDPYYSLSSKVKLVYLDINFDKMYSLPMLKRIPLYLKLQRKYRKKLKEILFKIKPQITISLLRREINFINSIKDGSIKIGEIHFDRDNYRSLKDRNGRSPIKAVLAKIWMGKLIKELRELRKFIVLSVEDQLKWKELKNTIVINNPLPFMPDTVSECTKKKVIVVGRYTYQKGIDLMIEVWGMVAKKYPEWTLCVYGAGERHSFQQQVLDAQLERSVRLEAATPDIENKYLESSIFVLSSRYEGYPMAMIEAMACGLPVVSFACPCGPRDIVSEGVDGYLVESGNVELLAGRLSQLMQDESLRKKMGENARRNISRLQIDKIAEQWNDLFDSFNQ